MVLITAILLPVIIFTKYNIKSKIYKYSLYIILSSIVVFTGIQRISIKYHYTTDVFCGFILGIIFGYIYYMYIQFKVSNLNIEPFLLTFLNFLH